MAYIILIAEKPSVGINLAQVLGATKKCTGYFEGGGYIVTFCFGHILGLFDGADYNKEYADWKLEHYPLIPQPFKYKILKGKQEQFNVIKNLLARNDVVEIWVCTDFDVEGENIGKILLGAIKPKQPIKRMLLDEWTPDDIRRGMSQLKNYSEMKNLQDAGYCRMIADWLLGINYTSCSTLKYVANNSNHSIVLNIGRVILPTVKLIYDRDLKIRNFVPEDYFELYNTFASPNGEYKGQYFEDKNLKFKTKDYLEQIKNQLLGKSGVVIDKTVSKSKRNAPKLFDLGALQGHITSKYEDWNSDKVLKVCQSLYEERYITYPRTESRFLTTTLIEKAEKALNALKVGLPYENKIKFHTNKTVFDDSKVHSHSAIIPTYIIPTNLSKEKEIVYTAIKNSFLALFMPPAIYENTEIITRVDCFNFITKGKVLIDKGFLEIYGKDEQDDLLPEVNKNDSVKSSKLEVLSKQTKAPNHYTEKSLIVAMQTCGKNIPLDEDEELTEDQLAKFEVLEGYSIGTSATRAETLKKIIDAGYVQKKGKSLMITPMGEKLVNVFPIKELLDTDYTGKLQKALSDIEKGMLKKEQYLNYIVKFVQMGVDKIKNSSGVIADGTLASKDNEFLGKCRFCGDNVIENSKAYSCSNEKCKFVIFKNDHFLAKFKKKPTKTMVKALLKEGECKVEGMVSPTKNRKFNCTLKMIPKENGEFDWDIQFNNEPKINYHSTNNSSASAEKVSLGTCPVCKSAQVIDNGNKYSCENKECDYMIWKEDKYLNSLGASMTLDIAKELVKNQQVYLENLYSHSKKKHYNATLLYKKKEQYWGYEMKFGN